MLNKIDELLNSITMYRLVLYYLTLLLIVAFIYSIFGVLPFTGVRLGISTTILLIVSLLTNKLLEKIFKVQTNYESLYITALILVFIITPAKNLNDIFFLVIIATISMATKFILNIKGKHIFNPAAIAVLITAITIQRYASWWVGTLAMFPFTLLGILIVRKIRKLDLVFYFFISGIVSTFLFYILRGNTNIIQIIKNIFFDSPILFFAFVMLTEPLTTPPTALLQSIYGGIVGILFSPMHVGLLFTTPEIALSIGNIFSYIVSPKEKLTLKLTHKIKLTPNTYDFVFSSNQKLKFISGQYLEWTLSQNHVDSRGNRRYFTIASSPTENEIRIGIKFPEDKSSSFKREMLDMEIGNQIIASSLAGDFKLPNDKTQKLVFIAGGIGITPFRSIVKYLIDTNEKRDIVLIYSDKTKDMMVYKDIFDEAVTKLNLKVIYYESEKRGHITPVFLQQEIPDFKDRLFYLSGSNAMVIGFENVLSNLKLPKKQVKVDYFPGF